MKEDIIHRDLTVLNCLQLFKGESDARKGYL